MKKLVVGMLLGAAIAGGTAAAAISGYQTVIDAKETRIEILEDRVERLEASNRELKAENEFLYK